MYILNIEAKESTIDGFGVFALEDIGVGDIVWKYDSSHDKAISVEEYNTLDEKIKTELDRVAYLSPTTNRYVYPPDNDPARYTNHSEEHNLDTVIDLHVSEEPYFVANRNIKTGEELTNNYIQFDVAAKRGREVGWLK